MPNEIKGSATAKKLKHHSGPFFLATRDKKQPSPETILIAWLSYRLAHTRVAR